MSSSQNNCVLSQDILMEILSRLPIKDIGRLKCVSKGLNRLVSDSTFVKLHLQRSSKNTHMLLTFEDYHINRTRNYAVVCPVQELLDHPSSTLKTLHHKHLPFNRKYNVLGACNGLVCLQDSCIDDEFEEYWFRIGNPTTRVMTKDSPHIRLNRRDYWLMFGFGYDEWSDSYQVVLLDNNRNQSQKLEVSVCCLGDTCWRNTLTCDAVTPMIGLQSRGTCGAFVSGTLNWLVYPRSHCDDKRGPKMNELEIFCYDLRKETRSFFSMPDGILEVRAFEPVLKVLNGCLCLSHHHEDNFVVWLKREFIDEKSWSKLLNINYQDDIDQCPSYMNVICMREKDGAVLVANTVFDANFIWYNSRDDRREGREYYGQDIWSLFSYDYVQSLVFPCRK